MMCNCGRFNGAVIGVEPTTFALQKLKSIVAHIYTFYKSHKILKSYNPTKIDGTVPSKLPSMPTIRSKVRV